MFSPKIKKFIYSQQYNTNKKIDGVQLIPLKNFLGDEGDFSELLRLNSDGGLSFMPDFHLRQVNRTRLFPKSIKAWHMHEKQDEIWYVSPHHQLFIGLWDVRAKSTTSGNMMRINLGGGSSNLLFIPKGVAHGSANFGSQEIELFYFVNQQFNLENPDEYRVPWDHQGASFWTPERD